MALRVSDLKVTTCLVPASRSAATYYGASVPVDSADTAVYLVHAGAATATGLLDVNIQQGYPAPILNNLAVDRDTNIELDLTTNTKVAFKFTTPANGGVRVTQIRVAAFREGTIAAAKFVSATIQLGAAAPDDSDLFTPVQVVVETLATTGEVMAFNLVTPLDIAASTVAWVVLTADYAASTANNVHFYVDTVGSGGNAMIKTGTWQALVATQTGAVEVLGVDFTTITGADTVQTTAALDDRTHSVQVPCRQNTLGAIQRPKATVTTDAVIFGITAITEAKLRPVTNSPASVVVV